jgi:GTP-binding protein
MFMAAEIHKVQFTDVPEVAFFGRSNVGKSTLLNAIMGREICYASNKVGRTRTMNAYAVGGPEKAGGSGLLTIMDMPGYGKGSVKSWGTQLSKYLEQRKELKRVFFLMDPLHGLKDSDRVFLKMLRERAIPHQVVMNKIDRIFLKSTTRARIMSDHMETRRVQVEKMMQELKKDIQPKRDGPPALGEILACSGDMGKHARYASEKDGVVGINAIRWAILRATGLDRYVDPVERKELSGSMTSFAKQDKSLPVRDPDSIAYSPHTYA